MIEEPEENEFEENINTEEELIEESTEVIIEINLDEDQDNLTLAEESLYNTNQNNSDTDNDGYNDGSEIISLYNPLASSQKLVDSGLVSIYTNILYKYNILKPMPWVVQSLIEGDNSDIVFLNNSETGEFFSLKVIPNIDGLTLNNFREIMEANLEPGVSLENYNLGNNPALITNDALAVFMVTNDYVYSLEYVLGELDIINFATTFEMMLNSFELLEDNE